MRLNNSTASGDHLGFVLYIGFITGASPMLYFLGIPQFRVKLISFVQEWKFRMQSKKDKNRLVKVIF